MTKKAQNIWNRETFLSFEVDMAFTLNDIDLQMTLTFEQASVEYKNVVELCEL